MLQLLRFTKQNKSYALKNSINKFKYESKTIYCKHVGRDPHRLSHRLQRAVTQKHAFIPINIPATFTQSQMRNKKGTQTPKWIN